jgi:hypothetical protein
MDSGTIAQWGAVGLSLVAIAISWINRRADAIDALERRQDRHDARLQKVEADMAHLPSVDSIHKLEVSMTEIKGQLAVVSESVRPIKAIADRLQDAIIEGVHK